MKAPTSAATPSEAGRRRRIEKVLDLRQIDVPVLLDQQARGLVPEGLDVLGLPPAGDEHRGQGKPECSDSHCPYLSRDATRCQKEMHRFSFWMQLAQGYDYDPDEWHLIQP
jgi:hypothetical protein